MNYEIKGGSFPIVEVTLNKGEKVICESGAMCFRDASIAMSTSTDGGIKKMFGRLFSGDKLFHNIYTASIDNSKISFASCVPGAIKAIKISKGDSLICQKSSFLVALGDIEMSIFFNKKIGAGLFGGEGFIMQKMTGEGIVFIEIDGSEFDYTLGEGEQLVLSTGHLVSMSESCKLDIEMVKGAKNIFFGGEGLFNTIVTGPGVVTAQTMPIEKLAKSIDPYITKQQVNYSSNNNGD